MAIITQFPHRIQKSGNTRTNTTNASRKAMLAKVHIAKKNLGMDDATYRELLGNNFNVTSSADLSNDGLHRLVLYLVGLGFTPTGKGGSARPKGSFSKAKMNKIGALLAEKGADEGTAVPWNYAIGILKRQTGGHATRFDMATDTELDAVIAALVRDAKRKGRYVEQWGKAVED